MSLAAELQPDQNPELWNNHVTVYEEVFERVQGTRGRTLFWKLVRKNFELVDLGRLGKQVAGLGFFH
jgi:hypothetical protein